MMDLIIYIIMLFLAIRNEFRNLLLKITDRRIQEFVIKNNW